MLEVQFHAASQEIDNALDISGLQWSMMWRSMRESSYTCPEAAVFVNASRRAAHAEMSYRHVRYQCIVTELMAGISHCIAAATSRDEHRKSNNLEHALSAYRNATGWMHETRLTPTMKRSLRTKVEYLEQLLGRCRTSKVIFTLGPLKLDRSCFGGCDFRLHRMPVNGHHANGDCLVRFDSDKSAEEGYDAVLSKAKAHWDSGAKYEITLQGSTARIFAKK